MKQIVVLAILVGVSGCLNPFRTDSIIRVAGPIEAKVVAEIPSTSNEHPIIEMPVDGAKACDGPRVAIIDVDGLLLNTNLTGPYSSGDNPIDLFREKLDAAQSNPQCVAVVLRVNSPGGSITATDVMWRELIAFKEKTHKPVVGCIMDLGCGGGYYLATGCDQIVAHPTSVIGGIGVLLNLYNFQGTLQLAKAEYLSIKAKASPKIDLDYRIGLLGEEDKELLIALADEFHDRFQTVVKQRRPAVKADEVGTFDGRVFSARQGLSRGLIDKIGYMPDALETARQLAQAPAASAVILHRRGDVARTQYATTPNVPLQANLLPISLPGADRNKLPNFLYLWQPDPSMERMSGK